jgi:hypothetical protein
VGSYYYLAAQLPALGYGQAAPMTSSAFRALARDAMNDADAAILDLCNLDPGLDAAVPAYAKSAASSSCDFIDNWREWERTLRLNLARFRAQKIKRDGGAPVDPPAHPANAAGVAKAAVSMESSPLEAELYLDKARWDAIESFQGIQYFSRNTMYAYLLKLMLMERRNKFKTEEGFTEYKGLYASIIEAASNT